MKHRPLCMGQALEVCEALIRGSLRLFHLLFQLHMWCSQQQNYCSSKKKKNWWVCVCFFLSQKLQEKTTSCERPANDRKRKFIKSDLALDTEGRTEGEVNFTASKHLAKFNWFVATCAANYRISITAQRPVIILTSLFSVVRNTNWLVISCTHAQWAPMAYQPVIVNALVSDTSLELWLFFNCLQTLISASVSLSELFQDLSQLQETWLAEGECFKSWAKKGGEMGKNE